MSQTRFHSRMIVQVADWLIEGMRHSDIVGALREENPKLSDKDFHEILDAAIEQITERNGDEALTVAFHIEARRELYRKCLGISDFKAAHSILQDITKLQGLYNGPKQPAKSAGEPITIGIHDRMPDFR